MPFRLKAEDSPAPADPEVLRINLADDLRALVAGARQLREICAHGGGDPLAAYRKAQPRTVELYEDAARALDTYEAWCKAQRAQRAAGVDLGAS